MGGDQRWNLQYQRSVNFTKVWTSPRSELHQRSELWWPTFCEPSVPTFCKPWSEPSFAPLLSALCDILMHWHLLPSFTFTADLHDRHHHTVEVCTGTGKAHFTHYKLPTHTIGCLHTHLPICMHFHVPSTCTYYMYQHYVTYMYRYIDIYFLLLPLLTCCNLCLDRINLRGFIVSIRTAI